MTSKLVTWVNSWFYNPGTPQTPTNDRMFCYEAAVVLVGEMIYGSPAFRELRNIHDLLTYLLLGWNPITAWPKISEFQNSGKDIECIESVKDLQKRMLNFRGSSPRSCFYPFLNYVTQSCKQHGSKSDELFIGERLTMLMLSLWLLKRKTEIPLKDLGMIRALLDLHYRSESTVTFQIEIEYARTNHDLHYCEWFNKQVDRMLRINLKTEDIINNLAYAGWFMSLIRVNRMLKSNPRNAEWTEEARKLLDHEVEMMRSALYHADLRYSEDQIREGSDLQNSSKLFRIFRIKPPPVKIRPGKS